MPETFDPRRAEPGAHLIWHDEYGERHEARADEEGVLWPKNAGQARLADEFGLPVARKAQAEHKAAVTAKEGS